MGDNKPIGDKTALNLKIEHLQAQIDESQVKDRRKGVEWLISNYKGLGAIAALFITNGAQLGTVTLPSLNNAKVSGAEATAAQSALRMTASRWMEEIADARTDERGICREQKKELNAHWKARLENHIHPGTP